MPKIASWLALVFVGLLCACSQEKPLPSEQLAAQAVQETPVPGDYLADSHHDRKVKCSDCHEPSFKLDDNESIENSRCIGCHGTLEQLGAKASTVIAAHRSHLGKINCTVCHHGHTFSQAYCSNCHFFNLSIPFDGYPVFPPKNPPASDSDDSEPKVTDTTDVVVIGSGGAGLTAAITAHDLGASVIVLEKQPLTGGNTMLSAGGMNAANTSIQRSLGIVDSVQWMIADAMAAGGGENERVLVEILAANSAGSVDWLTSLGVDLTDVGKLAGSSVRRAHRPKGGKAIGAHLIAKLRAAAESRGIDIRVNSRVVKIVKDAQGKVTGVQVQGKQTGLYAISAKAVVVAAGGFSASPARVTQHRPDFAGMITSNQPGATGDGMDLGAAIAGNLVDMNLIQIHPTLAAGNRTLITEAVRGNGGILINRQGLRFVNEMDTRNIVSAKVLAQTGATAFVVFDQGVRTSLAQIEGYGRLGLIKEGATLEDLAEALAVPIAALEATIGRYNQAYFANPANAVDPDFGRLIPRALTQPPFFAIEVAPGIHYTMGGLEIDTETRVIATNGAPIAGLFAAGEVTGGVHGKDRLGGNSISETITFGRIAGTNATALAKAASGN